eukprot:363130-Chlamydomonas_euryale.AAC.9
MPPRTHLHRERAPQPVQHRGHLHRPFTRGRRPRGHPASRPSERRQPLSRLGHLLARRRLAQLRRGQRRVLRRPPHQPEHRHKPGGRRGIASSDAGRRRGARLRHHRLQRGARSAVERRVQEQHVVQPVSATADCVGG